MNLLLQRVESSIVRAKLLPRGQAVLVAVSGGVDSMVLLHVLHELAAKHRWKIVVAHFNHQLRGRASDGDEKLVRQTAARLKLKCVSGRGDVRGFARKSKVSVEMAARELRHQFLAGAARRLKIKTIAIAHHADDQVELFFLRLLRGAGSAGLGGMSASAASPVDAKIRLIRPLLEVFKTDLAAFAEKRGILFREDASNASLDYQRNRIRRELLPLLRQKYQRALEKTVLRVMDIVREEGRWTRAAAEQWLRQKRAGRWDELPVALQRQCLQLQLRARGIEPDFEMIERLREQAGAAFPLTPALSRRERGDPTPQLGKIERARFSKRGQKSPPLLGERAGVRGATARNVGKRSLEADDSVQIKLTTPRGGAEIGAAMFRWWITRFNGASGRLPKFYPRCEFFDADKVGTQVCVRHWRAGDRFQPIGMKQAVKLQDLFTNLKVPRTERHRRWLAVAESGAIFWVEGLRIGEQFKLDKSTRRRFKWQWRRGVRSK